MAVTIMTHQYIDVSLHLYLLQTQSHSSTEQAFIVSAHDPEYTWYFNLLTM